MTSEKVEVSFAGIHSRTEYYDNALSTLMIELQLIDMKYALHIVASHMVIN